MKTLHNIRHYPLLRNALLILSSCCLIFISSSQAQQDDTQALENTAWQLVQIMSMDDSVFTPQEPDRYLLKFEQEGRLSVRVDCNRGQGSWMTEGPGQLEFGPLATTKALCSPNSLHDRFLSDLQYVRSYVFKNGHLFLATMADGAILEFEPEAVNND